MIPSTPKKYTVKKRQFAALLGSGMALILGVCLIMLALLGPTPPDPTTADVQTLTGFLAGDKFADLSSGQRETFYRDVTDRYLSMSPSERITFEDSWREHRKTAEMRRRIEAEMALALVRKLSDDYFATPPDERGFYLDSVLFMLRATNSPLSREFRTWAEGNPVQDRLGDPRDMAQGIDNFRRDVLENTNASERAALYRFAGDLLKHARHR